MPTYFGEAEEKAVLEYNKAKTPEEKDKIYMKKLHKAMEHLAECVFHRNSFPYMRQEYGEEGAQQVLLSFFVTILPKYVPSRGKAFSFLNFCGRNFCIQQNDAAYERSLAFVPIAEEFDEPEHSHQKSPKQLVINDKFHDLDLTEFMRLSADYWEKRRDKVCLKERQRIVFDEVLRLLRNPESLEFVGKTGTGKKEILSGMRNALGLKTCQLRPMMMKIKEKQLELLKEYIATGKLGAKDYDSNEGKISL